MNIENNIEQIKNLFKKRKEEILKYINSVSGNYWNYYSLHDFGIQFLEAFFLKVEELKIYSKSDIMTLLKSSEFMENNFSESIFINKEDILPSDKCLTKNDIWKIIVDKKGIKNCKVFLAKEINKNKLKGGYVIYLLKDFHLSYDEYSKKVIEDINLTLIKRRALCEDFFTIEFLKKKKIVLDIVLSITELPDKNELLDIMAQVISSIQEKFTPTVQFSPLEEIKKKKSIEKILDGPFLENGFLNMSKSKSEFIAESIHISECIKIICNVSNKINVSSVSFFNSKKEKFDSIINCEKNEYLYLDLSNLSIKILYKNKYIDLPSNQIEYFYSKLLIKNFISGSSRNNIENPMENNLGFINLDNYEPIASILSSHFYNISSGKYQNSEKKSISIKNIRSYILFFDQLLYNNFKLLKTIPQVFLNALDKNSSYHDKFNLPINSDSEIFFKSLSEDNSENIFLNQKKFIIESSHKSYSLNKFSVSTLHEYLGELSKINNIQIKQFDSCIDFILKMFGKKYYEEVVLLDKLSIEDQIKKRIRIKKNILSLIKKKSHSENLNPYSIATIELKKELYALLDIDTNKEKIYTISELFNDSIHNSNVIHLNDNQKKNINEFNNMYKKNFHTKKIKFIGNSFPFLEILMNKCLYKKNFSITKKKSYEIEININNNSEKNFIQLQPDYSIDSIAHAEYVISLVINYFKNLNKKMEMMYIIEHIFLRDNDFLPNDNNLDYYSFFLTIALPTWPAKFQTENFKNLFSKIILETVPAHIRTNILWLNYEDFILFEKLYFEWINNFNLDRNSSFTKKAAKNLLGLILSFSSDMNNIGYSF